MTILLDSRDLRTMPYFVDLLLFLNTQSSCPTRNRTNAWRRPFPHYAVQQSSSRLCPRGAQYLKSVRCSWLWCGQVTLMPSLSILVVSATSDAFETVAPLCVSKRPSETQSSSLYFFLALRHRSSFLSKQIKFVLRYKRLLSFIFSSSIWLIHSLWWKKWDAH